MEDRLEIKTVTRKPEVVQAVQFKNPLDGEKIAHWVAGLGHVLLDWGHFGMIRITKYKDANTVDFDIPMKPNDYLIKRTDGKYEVVSASEFDRAFE